MRRLKPPKGYKEVGRCEVCKFFGVSRGNLYSSRYCGHPKVVDDESDILGPEVEEFGVCPLFKKVK
jgi:hypothetical protein